MNLPQRPSCSCQQTSCEEEKAVTGGCHLTLVCVHSASALLPPAWFWGLTQVMETSPKAVKAVARAGSSLGEKTHQGTVPVSTSTTNLTWQGTCEVAGCWGSQQGGRVCWQWEITSLRAVLALISAKLGFWRWWCHTKEKAPILHQLSCSERRVSYHSLE